MAGAPGQADLGQGLGGACAGVAFPGQFQGQGDVFCRGHGRNQVEGLEDDPHMLTAEAGQSVLVEGAEVLAGDRDAAGARPLQPADDGQERGFAGAGRADHRHMAAMIDGEADTAQNVDRAGGAVERKADVAKPDDGVGHEGNTAPEVTMGAGR